MIYDLRFPIQLCRYHNRAHIRRSRNHGITRISTESRRSQISPCQTWSYADWHGFAFMSFPRRACPRPDRGRESRFHNHEVHESHEGEHKGIAVSEPRNLALAPVGDANHAKSEYSRDHPQIAQISQPGLRPEPNRLTQRHKATKKRPYPGIAHFVIFVASCESNSF